MIQRMVAILTGVLGAALITASAALADEASFVEEVGMNGLTPTDGKTWWGRAICTDLHSGVSVGTVYQNVATQTLAGRTGLFVGSAVRNLCPDQMPKWQAWMGQR